MRASIAFGRACVALAFCMSGTANASGLWDRWTELNDSWGSAELEFSCSYLASTPGYSQYRISKPVVGPLSIFGYGNALSWEPIQILAFREGGFYFSDRVKLTPESVLAIVKNNPQYTSFVDALRREFDERQEAKSKSAESERLAKLTDAKRLYEACGKKPLPSDVEAEAERWQRSSPEMAETTRSLGRRKQCIDLEIAVSLLEDANGFSSDSFSPLEALDFEVKLISNHVDAVVGIDFKKGVAEVISSDPLEYSVSLKSDPAQRFSGTLDGIEGTLGACRSD